ncbi:amino acid ABC transporter permease [Acidaminococcus sp. BV3L6]|uniref:amino acid ABC transporter permease n=1 Tax=Acidaminococcus sp. (strain BV3L6) TaxID=1111120 RepID=UPI0003AE30E3|nr:amino acid ABC transporter permease [Acidaminococcus sp. BV3L6]ERL20079.1 ABC transporter, permease protein [Acidaminococcus sp. BV3L6]
MPKLFDPQVVIDGIPQLLPYLPITMEIVMVSACFALILGFAIALIKTYRVPILRRLATIYVSYMRGTPLLVQLYISFYGVPIALEYANRYFETQYSINSLSGMIFVIVAFSLNEAAYASETIRAALEAIDKGQIEAGYSIGLTKAQLFHYIILPETLKIAIPSLGNIFIGLLKGTSLAFVCSVVEMTAASRLISGRNLRFFEMYIALSLIYWVLSLISERIFAYLERRLKRSDNAIRSNKVKTQEALVKE